jgi:hypothetical protein
MKGIVSIRHCAILGASIALLAGCGGAQQLFGGPGLMEQPGSAATRRGDDASLRAPNGASEDLLYTANSTYVNVYSYPQGKLEGKLSGFAPATGLCANARGDVFVVSISGHIHIYPHGGNKAIRVLKRPLYGALSCSVDPTTGNLAVASFGFVAVYKKARGNPIIYQSSKFPQISYCGYDDKGNLFVDSLERPYKRSDVAFGELPRGGATLEEITLNQEIEWPGQVQWDGRYITVVDHYVPAVYRFSISGRRGTKVGTTSLGDPAEYVNGSWIHGSTIVAPNVYSTGEGASRKTYTDILFYRYPAGGKPFTVIPHADNDYPNSAVVSLASH